MHTDSAAAAESDPLKAVADAMDAAVEAAKQGAAKAGETATGLAPAAGQAISSAVYRTSYAISYGVVFPAMLIARAIPGNNALVHGLIDGAKAAMDTVKDRKAEPAPEAAP
jgi:hypothetical protein